MGILGQIKERNIYKYKNITDCIMKFLLPIDKENNAVIMYESGLFEKIRKENIYKYVKPHLECKPWNNMKTIHEIIDSIMSVDSDSSYNEKIEKINNEINKSDYFKRHYNDKFLPVPMCLYNKGVEVLDFLYDEQNPASNIIFKPNKDFEKYMNIHGYKMSHSDYDPGEVASYAYKKDNKTKDDFTVGDLHTWATILQSYGIDDTNSISKKEYVG